MEPSPPLSSLLTAGFPGGQGQGQGREAVDTNTCVVWCALFSSNDVEMFCVMFFLVDAPSFVLIQNRTAPCS